MRLVQNPVAAEVTRLKLQECQRIWNLLTSAATVLKEVRMNTKLNHVHNWPELARQAQWSASALAKLCGVSARTLHRHFLKQMGMTTRTWLARQRQHNAVELLRDGSSVKETASCLGYKQPTNFTRQYKKQTGICPSLFGGAIAPSKPRLSAND